MFGVGLRFDHEFTGVVFPARALDAATVTADPGLRPYARQFLQALPAPRAETLTAEVGSLVEFLLPLGRCSMVHVSRDLGMQPRTLHRRLIAAGTTGPTGALAAALAPAAVRASGLGVLALAYNRLGLFTGPLIIGLLADRLGLTTAMRLAPAVSLAVIGVLAAGRLAYPGSIRRIEARPRCRRTGHPVGRSGPRRAQRACFGSPPWTVIA